MPETDRRWRSGVGQDQARTKPALVAEPTMPTYSNGRFMTLSCSFVCIKSRVRARGSSEVSERGAQFCLVDPALLVASAQSEPSFSTSLESADSGIGGRSSSSGLALRFASIHAWMSWACQRTLRCPIRIGVGNSRAASRAHSRVFPKPTRTRTSSKRSNVKKSVRLVYGRDGAVRSSLMLEILMNPEARNPEIARQN